VLPKTHTHVMMTQLNIKDGLKAFRNKGDKAILKEIKQLHTRQALMTRSRNDLSYEERKRALRYLMFLKEKRDGTIKTAGHKEYIQVKKIKVRPLYQLRQ